MRAKALNVDLRGAAANVHPPVFPRIEFERDPFILPFGSDSLAASERGSFGSTSKRSVCSKDSWYRSTTLKPSRAAFVLYAGPKALSVRSDLIHP